MSSMKIQEIPFFLPNSRVFSRETFAVSMARDFIVTRRPQSFATFSRLSSRKSPGSVEQILYVFSLGYIGITASMQICRYKSLSWRGGPARQPRTNAYPKWPTPPFQRIIIGRVYNVCACILLCVFECVCVCVPVPTWTTGF